MKCPEENKVYVLNPHYRLRHDIHRVILFADTGADSACSPDWHTFIHPLQAVLLSFFTYNRPWRETRPLLCSFFCRDEEEMTAWVSEFIENPTPVYTLVMKGKVYFPKRVLVEANEKDGKARFDRLDPNRFVWRKLDLTTRRMYSGPLLITLMLTNRCVTRCRYCYADTSTPVKTPLSTSRIKELIEEADRMQVQQVGLIGGEIFLHPDWKEILTELTERGIAPAYISTKIPFTETLIRDLQSTGYKGIIQISLDACRPDILSELLGVRTRYATEMIHRLKLLDESGLNYQVSSVLTRNNCDAAILGELYHCLKQLKHLRDWRIVPVNNSGGKEYKELAILKPTKEQIRQTFCQLRRITDTAPFPVIMGMQAIDNEYGNTPGGSRHFKGSECSALTTHLFILPDGKATICEQLYWHPDFIIGDVSTQSIEEVWHSPRAMQLYSLSRKDISRESACKSCRTFEDCFTYQNRCWSNIVKAYGTKHWDYPDPRCCHAPCMTNPLGYDD